MSTAFVFPGQGSQSIGMLASLAEQFPSIQQTFAEASEALGYDLWTLTQTGPEEQLGQTEFTQPALLAAGVAVWRVWQSEGGITPNVMAGHSLGEYTALCCAGAIEFKDAVTLVQDRGRYMQNAVAKGEGGMAAIIGLDDQAVIDVCASIENQGIIQAVNFNAPGQVVVAGHQAAIKASVSAFKAAGAKRALPLPVSIPAHSQLMTPAAQQLKQRIDSINVTLPSIPVIHNCNVTVATDVADVKANLVTQLDSPVQWVATIEKITAEQGEYASTQVIESGPGKVLCGMIKRIAKGTAVAAIDTPDSLTTALS